MKRSPVVVAALALVLALPATALAYTSPTWNLDGSYIIDFECTNIACGGNYHIEHHMTISTTSDETGAVTGTGHYHPGTPTWVVTGQVTGWDVVLDVAYDISPFPDGSPYVVHMIGAIDQHGEMSGSATAPIGQTFTWRIWRTEGQVGLFSPRCEYGTYPGATRLAWDGFASATGDVITTPVLDPTRDYFLETSGTYFAGGDGPFDIQADAEYGQDAVQRAASEAWTDSVNHYGSSGEAFLELLVDGSPVEWGAYSADHRYTLDVVPTGSPLEISANINDVDPSDNTGGLCVGVYVKDGFTGFFAPVDDLPTVNLVKAGSAIPVKFGLGGNRGLDIFWTGYPMSQTISCGSADEVDGIEQTVSAGRSSLSYDAVADQYKYVWKTDKAWAGTCRQLVLRFADGTYHRANFKFR